MRISKEKYFKDMARSLLKGYFAGLKEPKQCQNGTIKDKRKDSPQE